MDDSWNGEPGWPRPRRVPMPGRGGMAASCFVQDTADDPLSANQERLRTCFEKFVCQVCGEPVLSVDRNGWVLFPAANMGGACCTRCMYLAVRTCPHLAGVPNEGYELWAVGSWDDYQWHIIDGTTKGKVVPSRERGKCHTWIEFLTRYKGWKANPEAGAIDTT